MSVYKKLMEARIMLQSIPMKKSGLNKFAGYEYFELSDFIPHVQKIFNQLGLCGVVSYEKELATLTITDTDDFKQITITSPMAEANLKGCHPVQNLGAVETYQRRYLWVTALEILEHDALDSSEPQKDQQKQEAKKDPAVKKFLTPEMEKSWSLARDAFIRDKNLKAVLARFNMTKEHQEQLIKEAESDGDIPQ